MQTGRNWSLRDEGHVLENPILCLFFWFLTNSFHPRLMCINYFANNEPVQSSYKHCRKDETVLCRGRIGHTHLTHSYIRGAGRSSEVERSLMVRWVVGSILRGVDPLSYFSFQPVLHDWCNKGRGMCYPVLFNDALNTFYLRLYGVRHMVKDHSDSEKGNPLPPHRLLLSINSKGSFICTIPQTGQHHLLHQSWSTGWNDK